MRQSLRQTPNGKTRDGTPGSLLEDVRSEKRPIGLLSGMIDFELVGYAEWLIHSLDVNGREELRIADPGLHNALSKRKLMDEVGLPKKDRDWGVLNREKLASHAKAFIAEKEIRGRKGLEKLDRGLYVALAARGLLDEAGLPNSKKDNRDWAGMDRNELVTYAKKFIAERGIPGRGELNRADTGLYQALWRRKLLHTVFSRREFSDNKYAVDGVLDALDDFNPASDR